MNEKLYVLDFGPIKFVDLDIKKTIVFIGPQSSGKSTVAKLLAIFRSIEIIVSEIEINQYFQDYNIFKYFTKDTLFKYSNSNYTISYSKRKWSFEKTTEFNTQIDIEKERIKKLVTAVVDERYKDDTIIQKEERIKQLYDYNWKYLFGLLKKQIYIPAERILTSLISESGFSFNDISIPGCLKEFGKQFEDTRIRVKELEIPYLNITYKYEDKGDSKGHRIYFDKNNSISLSESSSGIQAVIPMLIVIENLIKAENSYSFIVEEPELNLFPTTQKSILNYLIQKNNHRNELVITTHSPYVLTVLNNFLFARNVAKQNEVSNKISNADIEKIIPTSSWIDHNDFNAYYFSEGQAKCIVNPNTNLIFENELDRVSQNIMGERDNLIELYKLAR